MAIKLNAAYSKKLGLPNYSSHSFAASVEVELSDPGSIAAETARLYATLQASVDNEIRQVGYMPESSYGESPPNGNHNGYRNGQAGPGVNRRIGDAQPAAWNCSARQRQLIAELAEELGLSSEEVDERSTRLFHRPARSLDRTGASGLIGDLLAEAGIRRQRNGQNRNHTAG